MLLLICALLRGATAECMACSSPACTTDTQLPADPPAKCCATCPDLDPCNANGPTCTGITAVCSVTQQTAPCKGECLDVTDCWFGCQDPEDPDPAKWTPEKTAWCENEATVCTTSCFGLIEPVCGGTEASDRVTYDNSCELNKAAACQSKQLRVLHSGACAPTCATVDCGRGGTHECVDHIDGASCQYAMRNCEENNVACDGVGAQCVAPECTGLCLTTPTCHFDCSTPETPTAQKAAYCCQQEQQCAFNPLCGSDDVTYDNYCQFNYFRCTAPDVYVQHTGACRPRDPCPSTFCAPVVCQSEWGVVQESDCCETCVDCATIRCGLPNCPKGVEAIKLPTDCCATCPDPCDPSLCTEVVCEDGAMPITKGCCPVCPAVDPCKDIQCPILECEATFAPAPNQCCPTCDCGAVACESLEGCSAEEAIQDNTSCCPHCPQGAGCLNCTSLESQGCTAEEAFTPEGTCCPQCPVVTDCSADTKLCWDGSFVARSPPQCEFDLCPEGGAASSPCSQTCTKEYKPVCALGQTFGNQCELEIAQCADDALVAAAADAGICPGHQDCDDDNVLASESKFFTKSAGCSLRTRDCMDVDDCLIDVCEAYQTQSGCTEAVDFLIACAKQRNIGHLEALSLKMGGCTTIESGCISWHPTAVGILTVLAACLL